MPYSIAQTINHLLAPRHELSCSWLLWRRLVSALRARGRHETRESGAFLLGRKTTDGPARITEFVLYDDLDPAALNTGIVRFDGRHFGKLWAHCRERNLTVVADVHVHPGGSGQSASDRAHPMIAEHGHIALILPDYARLPMPRGAIGIYRYLGAARWETIPRDTRRDFFCIAL